MKNLVLPAIATLLVSTSAFAKTTIPSIEARILPNAKVVSVSCTTPSHLSHDISIAGTVKVQTEENQIVEMAMLISRFAADQEKDASELCQRLKKLKKSGKPANLIFGENEYFYLESDRFFIMGEGLLNGLNPLYNG